MKTFYGVLAALALSTAAMPAAALTQVSDGSFETQGATVGGFCYFGACPAGAWSGSGAGLQDEANGDWPGAPTSAGSKYGFIQNLGYFEQTFTAADTGFYKLSWLAAGRPAGCCGGNQSYNVLLNNAIIASSATTTGQPFAAAASGAFQLVSGASYTLRFQGLSGGPDNTAFIDNVSLTAAVPEPATWAMMIMGFGLAGSAMRRRRAMTIAA